MPTELPKVMPPKGSKIEKLQSSLTCVKLLIGSRQIVTTTRGFLFSSQSPPHPQLQAQEAAEKWSQVWNPPLLPQTTALETLFTDLPNLHFPCPTRHITCLSSRKLSHEAVSKASGLDGRTSRLWDFLPLALIGSLALAGMPCWSSAASSLESHPCFLAGQRRWGKASPRYCNASLEGLRGSYHESAALPMGPG